MQVDRNGLEILERKECLHLLAAGRIGRIGMSRDALPTILPVNYYFDGHNILVVTSVGAKLSAALRNTVVAFEVDDFDLRNHSGWSVVAVGVAKGVYDADELTRIRKLPVSRWATKGDCYVVAISVDWISGRRIVPSTSRSTEWHPPHDLRATALTRPEADAAS